MVTIIKKQSVQPDLCIWKIGNQRSEWSWCMKTTAWQTLIKIKKDKFKFTLHCRSIFQSKIQLIIKRLLFLLAWKQILHLYQFQADRQTEQRGHATE